MWNISTILRGVLCEVVNVVEMVSYGFYVYYVVSGHNKRFRDPGPGGPGIKGGFVVTYEAGNNMKIAGMREQGDDRWR